MLLCVNVSEIPHGFCPAYSASEMGVLYILFESAVGFALFERVKTDEIGLSLKGIQDSINNRERFSKIVKLKCTYALVVPTFIEPLHP